MVQIILAILSIYVFGIIIGEAFSGSQPGVSTTLASGMTASDTSASVTASDNFPAAGYIYVNGEVMRYASKTATTFDGLLRAQLDTEARSHSVGAIAYSESSGVINSLAGLEDRTAVTEAGTLETLWNQAKSISGMAAQAATWDYEIYSDGYLQYIRYIGVTLSLALAAGLGYLLISVFTGGIGTILRFFQ
jgi:hypothetical protein